MKSQTGVSPPVDLIVGAVHASDTELGAPSADDPNTPTWSSRDELEVEWRGRWWPATVMERRGSGRYLVHYTGYGDEWDEVVGAERLRLRRAPEPEITKEPSAGDNDP